MIPKERTTEWVVVAEKLGVRKTFGRELLQKGQRVFVAQRNGDMARLVLPVRGWAKVRTLKGDQLMKPIVDCPAEEWEVVADEMSVECAYGTETLRRGDRVHVGQHTQGEGNVRIVEPIEAWGRVVSAEGDIQIRPRVAEGATAWIVCAENLRVRRSFSRSLVPKGTVIWVTEVQGTRIKTLYPYKGWSVTHTPKKMPLAKPLLQRRLEEWEVAADGVRFRLTEGGDSGRLTAGVPRGTVVYMLSQTAHQQRFVYYPSWRAVEATVASRDADNAPQLRPVMCEPAQLYEVSGEAVSVKRTFGRTILQRGQLVYVSSINPEKKRAQLVYPVRGSCGTRTTDIMATPLLRPVLQEPAEEWVVVARAAAVRRTLGRGLLQRGTPVYVVQNERWRVKIIHPMRGWITKRTNAHAPIVRPLLGCKSEEWIVVAAQGASVKRTFGRALLPKGTVVYAVPYSDLGGAEKVSSARQSHNRLRILHPVKGWVSVWNKQGDTLLQQADDYNLFQSQEAIQSLPPTPTPLDSSTQALPTETVNLPSQHWVSPHHGFSLSESEAILRERSQHFKKPPISLLPGEVLDEPTPEEDRDGTKPPKTTSQPTAEAPPDSTFVPPISMSRTPPLPPIPPIPQAAPRREDRHRDPTIPGDRGHTFQAGDRARVIEDITVEHDDDNEHLDGRNQGLLSVGTTGRIVELMGSGQVMLRCSLRDGALVTVPLESAMLEPFTPPRSAREEASASDNYQRGSWVQVFSRSHKCWCKGVIKLVRGESLWFNTKLPTILILKNGSIAHTNHYAL